MQNDILIYSLKIWLTAVLLSPLLFLLILLLRTLQNHPDDQFSILLFAYVMLLANSFLYSLISLLIFGALTSWISKTDTLETRSKLPLIVGIAILFPVLYLIFNPYDDLISSTNNLWLMFSYIMIAVGSTTYYKKPLST